MPAETYDYIVVGSGSAGAVVAARLSENPGTSVLLLEAGPEDDADEIRIPAAFPTLFRTKWDWNYLTTAQKQLAGRRSDWPRMKALGGCSSMNSMIYIRGNHADYDEWRDSYGATGWGYDDVLPYFIKTESNDRFTGPFHGTNGPLHVEDRRYTHELSEAFVDAAVATGLKRNDDFNGAEQEGAGVYQVTCHKGQRWSVADAYLRPAMQRPNLTISTESFATKVLIEGGRAVGVSYRKLGVDRTAHASAEVIVSGGAINSPQLLMLSGIGPGAHLHEHGIDVVVESAGVGKNLQDHPAAGFLIYTKGTTDLAEFNTLGSLVKWKARKTGPLTSNVGEAGGFFKSRDDLSAPDLQIHVAPSGFYDNGIHEPARRAVTIAPTLVNVQSKGTLRLRSADPTWHPEIDPAYVAAAWWSALSVGVRADYLSKGKGVITRRMAELADVSHQETGKPHSDAQLEIVLAIDHIAWAAKHAKKVLGPKKVNPGLLMANQKATVEYKPLGVIGVIGPWNYPVFTPMGSIAYALAAGLDQHRREVLGTRSHDL